MKNKKEAIPILLFVFTVAFIYFRWFIPGSIIGGDWPYLFQETLKEFPLVVPSWNTWQANGLGGTNPTYFLQIFENITVNLTNVLHIPWEIVYKGLWFGLFLVLSVASSFYFSIKLFVQKSAWIFVVTSLIFITNTYVLMLASGGQMGVLLAYSLSPFVVAVFMNLINRIFENRERLYWSILAGLAFSFQLLFDPRIAYLSAIVIGIYLLYSCCVESINLHKFFRLILFFSIIPGIITALLHASWILPYMLSKQSFAGEFGGAYAGIGITKFLSFANFPQTLSLLHPNWPENIFGKVYFMRPEFLVIPCIAFSSLFFISKKKTQKENKVIIYFVILGLIGAFLSKGANIPFGQVYLEAFSHVPGFVFFRDPTKFYIFVILAFMVLIPYSLDQIAYALYSLKKAQELKIKKPHLIYFTFIIFFLFWVFTIHESILGQLNGTFQKHTIPQEYITFKNFLNNQHSFFRTLWIPREQRFTYYSNNHPAVEFAQLFNTSDESKSMHILNNPQTQKYISRLGIKYVVVPYDSLGEIFVKDRKYDPKSHDKFVQDIEKISWLHKIDGFGNLTVFQISQYNAHIFLEGEGNVESTLVTPYKYDVSVSISAPQKLIFSEKYNQYWIIKKDGKTIPSVKTSNNLNSFFLKDVGTYNLEIYFSQEDYYAYGRIISLSVLCGVIILLIILKRREKFIAE